MNIRATAAAVLYQIVKNGHSVSDELPFVLARIQNKRDQSFLQALVYGTCRFYFQLHAIAQFLLEKPLKAKDFDLYCLILIGLYQLSDMRVPEHAAVAETVAATAFFKKTWAKHWVNALLRNFIRRRKECEKAIQSDLAAVYAHPPWMIEQLQRDWPHHWQAILTENNNKPPFALRINQQMISRSDYIQQYLDNKKNKKNEKNETCAILPETSQGIILEPPQPVDTLPGFKEGMISVQDGASQLAATLLQLEPHQRVLDACAAPGGKAAHILELQPLVKLLAIDQDSQRLQAVIDHFKRLHLKGDCKVSDVSMIQGWWDGQLFDRILLDAPCSASGVIRRHPDIKILRRQTDIAQLAERQAHLLKTLWPLLRPDGILVYTTCSVFLAENVNILTAFLAEEPSANEDPIQSTWGLPCTVGRQILPGMHRMDGFYFARLRKGK